MTTFAFLSFATIFICYSEGKMSSYEEQLASLKNHISQLQEDFGDFENLKELHEMVMILRIFSDIQM